MNVTFTPLQTPTVRPADMPEEVAFDFEHAGHLRTGARTGLFIRPVSFQGIVQHDAAAICLADSQLLGPALLRRDGQPLPGQEPVPLDTLQPWPVWYRDVDGDYVSHDGQESFIWTDTTELHCCEATCKMPSVYPTPYKAEVQDER